MFSSLKRFFKFPLRVTYTAIEKPSAPGLVDTYQPTVLSAVLGPGSDTPFEDLLWLVLKSYSM